MFLSTAITFRFSLALVMLICAIAGLLVFAENSYILPWEEEATTIFTVMIIVFTNAATLVTIAGQNFG